MIDTSKFEKLEKEDLEAASGGFRDFGDIYDWVCDHFVPAEQMNFHYIPTCALCANKRSWRDSGDYVFGCDYEEYMHRV